MPGRRKELYLTNIEKFRGIVTIKSKLKNPIKTIGCDYAPQIIKLSNDKLYFSSSVGPEALAQIEKIKITFESVLNQRREYQLEIGGEPEVIEAQGEQECLYCLSYRIPELEKSSFNRDFMLAR